MCFNGVFNTGLDAIVASFLTTIAIYILGFLKVSDEQVYQRLEVHWDWL